MLLAHRNALVALTRFVLQERVGGLLGGATEMLVQVLEAKGAIAYRVEGSELVLVAEIGLPRKAKPWLARLPIDDAPWFVAQRVAKQVKPVVDEEIAGARQGHSIRPALEQAGWRALAAAPLAIGRQVGGVLVLAGGERDRFDRDTMLLLETAGGVLALALEREGLAQRQSEAALEQVRTGQLATLGLLTSTLACEMAAPLGALQLQLEDQEARLREIARRDAGPLPEDLEDLGALNEEMAEALRQAQNTASRMLSLLRESKPEPIDLSEIVGAALGLLRPSIESRGVQISVCGDDRPYVIDGRQESFSMMVVQLLLFAQSECQGVRTRTPAIRVALASEGERHQLTIEASGEGDPTGVSARLLEAFAGKRPGDPAAMGLALAKQTVLAHSGHVEVGASELGGMLVRVVLPPSRTAPERQRRFSSRPPPPPPTATAESMPLPAVVWIDDDELFVRSMRRCIKTHEVFGATTLAEARSVLASLGRVPDLVFCAVSLPDGPGVELHRAASPELASHFAFITGGVIPSETASYLVASGCPTLIKPIALEEIVELLGERNRRRHPSIAPTLSEVGDDDDMPTLIPPDEGAFRPGRRGGRQRRPTMRESPDAKKPG
jgi:signal transduction histidine kinase/ActR/RegA family two-component response regulator